MYRKLADWRAQKGEDRGVVALNALGKNKFDKIYSFLLAKIGR
jgi:hypothetical protein